MLALRRNLSKRPFDSNRTVSLFPDSRPPNVVVSDLHRSDSRAPADGQLAPVGKRDTKRNDAVRPSS